MAKNIKTTLTFFAFVAAFMAVMIGLKTCSDPIDNMPYYEPTLCIDSLDIIENYDAADFVPKRVEYIVIHCTAVPPSFSFTPKSLVDFFLRKWSRPGYRHFIPRDGTIYTLRAFNGDEYIDYEEITYGASGYNDVAIHIAYDGGLNANRRPEDTRTDKQKASLSALIAFYKGLYPNAKVIGHKNLSNKACPSFDAKSEYGDIQPFTDAIIEDTLLTQ